ncbi:hypothetical protein KFE26_13845 [Shewanella sp. M16]|uniref:hypothetical protein n=1 Tax=Shewanella TaxID=22 RepID=UPI001BB09306|nr:hypothetical protein [Shewanella sp. M16]MBS0043374.1 hypothetical protein [Shewanella sp. M16]QYW06205.1 hypothetical protein MuM161_p16 [Shewanella phage vB_SspS_MuM16-1]
MKKAILIILIVASTYIFIPVKVTGSLYVVTNSANVVPMPITQIKVYPLKEFKKALFDKQSYANKECMGLPDKNEVELAYLNGGPNRDNAKENYELIVSCETATLLKDIKFPADKIILTDKDGKFDFTRSRLDSVVLVAESKRQIGLGTEEYLWLRVVPRDGVLSQKIEINNKSLVQDIDVRTIQL